MNELTHCITHCWWRRYTFLRGSLFLCRFDEFHDHLLTSPVNADLLRRGRLYSWGEYGAPLDALEVMFI